MSPWRADKNREAVAEQQPASENEKAAPFQQNFFRPEFLKKEKRENSILNFLSFLSLLFCRDRK